MMVVAVAHHLHQPISVLEAMSLEHFFHYYSALAKFLESGDKKD